jgi:hypothetical protein
MNRPAAATAETMAVAREVGAMTWDLGAQGLGVLALDAIVFGLFAQVLAARYTTRWVGLIGAVAFFMCGLLISEVWFGWASEEELQPNIDGLSWDEVQLAWLVGIIAVLWVRHVGRRWHHVGSGHAAP